MPRVRGVVVASACAVGAVLGLNSFSLADATLVACGGGPGGVSQTAMCEQATASSAAKPVTPFVATATRHDPASTRALPAGVEDPATDRAMTLLVGWVVVVMVGGGLFAGRRPRPAADRG